MFAFVIIFNYFCSSIVLFCLYPEIMKLLVLKLTLVFVFSLIYMYPSHAQDTIPSLSADPYKKVNFWSRVALGGNLGVQFGSVTGITVSPEVRLRVVDQLHVGLRFIYQYYNYKDYYLEDGTGNLYGYSASVYGGGVYLRYYLNSLFDNWLGNLFAHAEYEYLYSTRPYTYDNNGRFIDPNGARFRKGTEIVTTSSLFIGGGYKQPISNKVSMDFLILFNLNDSYNSPYSNPIFRLGVGVGL